MSYSILLVNKEGNVVEVPSHEEGGTIAEFSVTYNYCEVYSLFGFSMWALNGMPAGCAVAAFDPLVTRLGTKQYPDYWAPTPGNAGHTLKVLLDWCRLHPDAVIQVH